MAFNPIRNPSDTLAVEQGCYFDEAAGLRAIKFVETFCRQSKGRQWGGQPLLLLDWQKDFLMRLFGWKRPNGLRRFKTAYLEVAKKNGKSTLVSALTLYLLLADGESAPEVYLNAVDREQASIVFDEAARMVEASPELKKRLETIKSKGRIVDPAGYGKIQKNSADAPSKDGVNASGIIFDEIHRFKNRDLWDVFKYAGASREQPLRIVITTAGEDEEGVWFEQRQLSEQINDGTNTLTTHLGVVYRAEETDDIDSPETWKKANPSLGVTLKEEEFREILEEIRGNPTELANFLRLRLNVVIRGDSAFCRVDDWDACATPHAFKVEARSPSYMGLDLSQTQDLTALITIIGDPIDGFDVHARFWLPEEGIEQLERQHQQPYRVWADQGYMTLTPGNVVDYEFVRAEINTFAAAHQPVKILVDPYNATKLGNELKEGDGLPVEYIRQGFLSLSAPTKELLRLILGKKLRHGGHPILKWHVSNCIAEQDAAGNLKLSKRKSKRKIDGAAALVNAIAAATGDEDGPSVYNSRGLLFV